MIDTNEHYFDNMDNSDFQRETKELFFGTPLWNEVGPESIGSVSTVKRQLYSSTTSYGRGKLILLSLYPNIASTVNFSLKIPAGLTAEYIEDLHEQFEYFAHKVKVTETTDSIEVELTKDISLASEEDFMFLLWAATEAWMLLHKADSFSVLTKESDLDDSTEAIESFMSEPDYDGYWIDFNLGFDLEAFLLTQ